MKRKKLLLTSINYCLSLQLLKLVFFLLQKLFKAVSSNVVHVKRSVLCGATLEVLHGATSNTRKINRVRLIIQWGQIDFTKKNYINKSSKKNYPNYLLKKIWNLNLNIQFSLRKFIGKLFQIRKMRNQLQFFLKKIMLYIMMHRLELFGYHMVSF